MFRVCFVFFLKIKTSDKILRRFDLAEIIFEYKKKMKNFAYKKFFISFLTLENDISEKEIYLEMCFEKSTYQDFFYFLF